MIVTSVIFHLFGLVLTFVITIVFHVIALMQSDCSLYQKSCETNLIFILTNLMIASGILSIFLCLTFSIYMQIKLVGACSDKTLSQQVEFSQVQPQLQPQTLNPANLYIHQNPNQNFYNR